MKSVNIAYGLIGIFIFNQLFIGIEPLALTPSGGLFYMFSSAFIHGDFIHLAMNSIALYWLSTQFKSIKAFILVYLGGLIVSSAFSMVFITYISPAMVVGASGAIFALFSYVFFRDGKDNEFYINFIAMNALPLVLGMNLAWYAHLGGAIFGYIYWIYGPKERIMWLLK